MHDPSREQKYDPWKNRTTAISHTCAHGRGTRTSRDTTEAMVSVLLSIVPAILSEAGVLDELAANSPLRRLYQVCLHYKKLAKQIDNLQAYES